MLAMYLAVLDDRSSEEQFIGVYNTYKRLVYHTAYKIMGDSYLAEDVLQEVFLYVAKNFSKIHRENCHAYKIMGDSYLAEDVLQEVFLYVAKNFSKIHRENCHELAAYLVSCSRSRAHTICFASSEKNRWKKSRTHQTMPRCRTMQ